MLGAANANSLYTTPSPALGGFDWMGSSVFQGNQLLNAQANALSLGMMDMRGLTAMVGRMNGAPLPPTATSPATASAQILQGVLLAAVAALSSQSGATGAPALPAAGSPLNLVRPR